MPYLHACAGWFDWPCHCRRDQAWVHAHRQHRWYAGQHRHVQGETIASKTKYVGRLATFSRVHRETNSSVGLSCILNRCYGRLTPRQLPSLRVGTEFEDQTVASVACFVCCVCQLYRPGTVAYVSKSGGMSNELNNIIARNSDGVYEGVAIGGDRYPGTRFIDHLLRYQDNPTISVRRRVVRSVHIAYLRQEPASS